MPFCFTEFGSTMAMNEVFVDAELPTKASLPIFNISAPKQIVPGSRDLSTFLLVSLYFKLTKRLNLKDLRIESNNSRDDNFSLAVSKGHLKIDLSSNSEVKLSD